MYRPWFCLAVCAITFTCGSQLRGDIVTLLPGAGGFPTGANVNALAGPLFGSDFADADIAGAGVGSESAMLAGNAATHDYAIELDFSGAPAFFDSSYVGFERTATIDPVLGGHRASAESVFHFTVDVLTLYDVTGFFAVDDLIGTTTPGNVELEVELLEFDAPDFTPAPPPVAKLYSYQKSEATLEEGLFVGGMGGDAVNVFEGDLKGVLDPAKFYRYRTLVTMVAFDADGPGPILPTDGAAIGMGAQTITFTAAVPEPSSVSLFAAVTAWCTFVRRRRNQPTIL